jgi:5'-methylthioadenosine phosphorylase
LAEAGIAFIGGSGLYDMDGLTDREEVELRTPFGAPSDAIVLGVLGETRVAFLPRHGRGHVLSPTRIPVRANIYALKSLGVERIVSISAVGSLKEEVMPLDLVVPDQLIDRTYARERTFFDDGVVGHVALAQPFCPDLSRNVAAAAETQGVTTHFGGACVVIEGPQFSTRAESELYRSWGGSIIGMTALPEAKLAREAEICYATMAFVTDYDCWHDDEESVSVDLVVANLNRNVATAREVIREVIAYQSVDRECACSDALKDAIITNPERITEEARERLSLIVGKYLNVAREVF